MLVSARLTSHGRVAASSSDRIRLRGRAGVKQLPPRAGLSGRSPRLKLLPAALVVDSTAAVVIAAATAAVVAVVVAAAEVSTAPPTTTTVRPSPFSPRRCNGAGARRRPARRRGGLAKDLCSGLVVAPLLLLAVALLLCADFVGRHLRLLRPSVVVVEGHLGQARDGVLLGDDGLAAEDFDLGLEGGGEGDAAAVGFNVVEGLCRITVSTQQKQSKGKSQQRSLRVA